MTGLFHHIRTSAAGILVAGLLAAIATSAGANPLGGSYTVTIVNLPGGGSAVVRVDGIPEPAGASGATVTEKAVDLGATTWVEITVRTADGGAFLGQQAMALDPVHAEISDLRHLTPGGGRGGSLQRARLLLRRNILRRQGRPPQVLARRAVRHLPTSAQGRQTHPWVCRVGR